MTCIDDPTQLLDSWLNELNNIGGQSDNSVKLPNVQCSIATDQTLKPTTHVNRTNNNLNNALKSPTPLSQSKSPKLPPKPANLLALRQGTQKTICNNLDSVNSSMGPAKDSSWPVSNNSHNATDNQGDSNKDDDLEAILGELLELEKQLALETNAVNDIESHPAPSLPNPIVPTLNLSVSSNVPFETPPPQFTNRNFPYSYTMNPDETNIHEQSDNFPPPPAPNDPLLSLPPNLPQNAASLEDVYCDDGRDSAFSDDLAGGRPHSKSSSSASSFFMHGPALSNRHSHDSQSSATNTEALDSKPNAHTMEKCFDPVDRSKEEKIRLALQKLKEANIKKMFVKAYSPDGSAKCVLVEEDKTCGQICALLALKNHMVTDIINWALVEHLPELMMERVLEDHEKLVENISYWTRESVNKMLFLKTEEKYEMFNGPNQTLTDLSFSSYKQSQNDPSPETTLKDVDSEINVSTSSDTLQASSMAKYKEYFIAKILQHQKSNTTSNIADMEGFLYLKLHKKKVWKKYWCVLRSSGLYFCPKSVKTNASKDLVCLCKFENVNVYYGFGWHKKYKAPTDFGFALKVPQVQVPLSKHTKYFCLENSGALKSWVNAIRLAKYGSKLAENFYEAKNTEILCVPNEDPSLTNLVKSVSDVNLALQNNMPSITTKQNPTCDHNSHPASSLKQGALQKRISLSPSNCSAGYNTSYSSSSGKGSSATNSADLSLLGVIMADNSESSDIHNNLYPDHRLPPELGIQSCEIAANKVACTTRSIQGAAPAILIKKSYPKMPLIGMAASVVASFQNGCQEVGDQARCDSLNHMMVTTTVTTTSPISSCDVQKPKINYNSPPVAIKPQASVGIGDKIFGTAHYNNTIAHKRGTPPPLPRRDPNTTLLPTHPDSIYANSCDMSSIVAPTSLRRSSLTCLTTTSLTSPNPISLQAHKITTKNPAETTTNLGSNYPMSPRFGRLPSNQTSPALTMNKMLVEELKRKQEKGSTLHLNSGKISSNRSSPHCANLWGPLSSTNSGDIYDGDDDILPPPPPELLEDLSETYYHQPLNHQQKLKPFHGQSVMRRVPPPPKRSETTRLSTTCSMILPSLH